jgi:hypothetical protein
MMRSDLKLVPDLIPQTSFFKNLRSLCPGDWNIIRHEAYRKAGFKCEVCGISGSNLCLLHCHEVWDYNEGTGIQKLVGVQVICSKCHEVKHFGLAQIRGRASQALSHMQKVNGIDREEAETIIEEAGAIWKRRSKQEWTLDVSVLASLKQ